MEDDLAKAIAAAIASRSPLPDFDVGMDLASAYALQREVTSIRCGDDIGGIKAGVTADGAQKFFKVDHALLGSLYGDGRLESPCTLPFVEGRALECEVAVIVDADGRPTSVAPAIEVVLVQFGRPSDMSAANLVACNLGADLFIVGEPLPWDYSLNDAVVTLERDGEVLNQVSVSDSLGGPEAAATWMSREARSQGFALGDGTLLMAGACGAVVPAEVGRYRADYGPLGAVEFGIEVSDRGD